MGFTQHIHFSSTKEQVLLVYDEKDFTNGAVYRNGKLTIRTHLDPFETLEMLRKTCEGDIVQLCWVSPVEENIPFPETTYELLYGRMWKFNGFHGINQK